MCDFSLCVYGVIPTGMSPQPLPNPLAGLTVQFRFRHVRRQSQGGRGKAGGEKDNLKPHVLKIYGAK